MDNVRVPFSNEAQGVYPIRSRPQPELEREPRMEQEKPKDTRGLSSAVFIIHSLPGFQAVVSRAEITMTPDDHGGNKFAITAATRLCSELRETLRHRQEGWYHLLNDQFRRLTDAVNSWHLQTPQAGEPFYPDLTWLLKNLDHVSRRQAHTGKVPELTPLMGLHFEHWKTKQSQLADILGIQLLHFTPTMSAQCSFQSTCTMVLEYESRPVERAPKLDHLIQRDILQLTENGDEKVMLQASQFIIVKCVSVCRTFIDFEGADVVEFRFEDLNSGVKSRPYVFIAVAGEHNSPGRLWNTFVRTRESGKSKWLFYDTRKASPPEKQPWEGNPMDYDVKFLIFESPESWNDPQRPSPPHRPW